ncbi:MAG: hypothetical protein ACYSU7_11025 [Planctomycetota bacterium]|jgi:hypothetical protein
MSCRFLALATLAAVPASDATAGVEVALYAELCTPMRICLTPGGIMYVGNNGCGGEHDDPAWVRRVGVGGSPVENYGDQPIADADAVAYDGNGQISGVVASVLVGGRVTGLEGRITAILPDESTVTVFAGPPLFNPSALEFDGSGRLLILDDSNPATVLVTEGNAPEQLFTIPSAFEPAGLAIDILGRIYTIAEDGVIRVHNADGSVHHEAFATGLGPGVRLAFGHGGEWGFHLYAISGGELLRFDASGNYEVLAADLWPVADMEFGPFVVDDALYLTGGGAIRRLTLVPCQADIDGDGIVDVSDFLVLLGQWGPCPPVCIADIDNDGTVGVLDFLLLLGNWGPCL